MTFTAKQVAEHYGVDVKTVQYRVRRRSRGKAVQGQWAHYCEPGSFVFKTMPPPFVSNTPSQKRKRAAASMATTPSFSYLAAHVLPGANPLVLKNKEMPEPAPGSNNLAWAAYWALRGMKVFPCESFVGSPLISFSKFDQPTDNLVQIQRYWTQTPDADIGVYPDQMGMFVIEIHRNCTEEPNIDLSGALITGKSILGDRRFWFPGRVFTRLHALGEWVHLIGIGEHSFLPPSIAGGMVQ